MPNQFDVINRLNRATPLSDNTQGNGVNELTIPDKNALEAPSNLSIPQPKRPDELSNQYVNRQYDYYTDPTALPDAQQGDKWSLKDVAFTSLKGLAFMLSPLSAPSHFVLAPIAEEKYEGDKRIEEALSVAKKKAPIFGEVSESLLIAGQAAMNSLFPTWGEIPDYAGKITERLIPEANQLTKSSVSLVIDLMADPSVSMGLGSRKIVQKGLQLTRAQVRAGMIPPTDPITAGIREIMMIAPETNMPEDQWGPLAARAASGDKGAFGELVGFIDDKQYEKIFGDIAKKEHAQFAERLADDFGISGVYLAEKKYTQLESAYKDKWFRELSAKYQETTQSFSDRKYAQKYSLRQAEEKAKEFIANTPLPPEVETRFRAAAGQYAEEARKAAEGNLVLKMRELTDLNNFDTVRSLMQTGDIYRLFKLNKFVVDASNLPDAIQQMAEEYQKIFKKYIRPTMTMEDIAEGAKSVELKELTGWKKGTVWNAEQQFAARAVVHSTYGELRRMAIKADTTKEIYDVGGLIKAADIFEKVYVGMVGSASEAGRTLRMQREMFHEATDMKSFAEVLNNISYYQDKGLDRAAFIMGALTKTAEKSGFGIQYAKRAAGSWRKGEDALYEAYVHGNLWSILTSIVNVTSTAVTVAMRPFERYATILAGNKTAIAEGTQETIALAEGAKDAFYFLRDSAIQSKMAGRVLSSKTRQAAKHRMLNLAEKYPEEYLDPLGFLLDGDQKSLHEFGEIVKRKNISAINFGLDPTSKFGKAVDAFGSYTRIPGGALSYQDAAFKVIGYRMGVRHEAYKLANKYPVRNAATRDLVFRSVIENPSPEVIKKAKDAGAYLTYQTPFKGGWKTAQSFLQSRYMRWFFPYFRTPVNLIMMGAERSPLGIYSVFKAALKGNSEEVQMAISRTAIGTAAMMAVAATIDEDHLVGSYEFNSPYGRKMASLGIRPYSIRFGDTWYSFEGVDFLRSTLGLVADFKRGMAHLDLMDPEEVNLGVVLSATAVGPFVKMSTNQRWLDELGSVLYLVDAAREEDTDFFKVMGKEMTNISRNMVPSSRLLREFNRAYVDEDFRIAEGFIQTMMGGIPGLSSRLPAYKDLEGNDIVWHETHGPDVIHRTYEFISPFKARPHKSDLVRDELLKIPINLPPLVREIKGVKLKPIEKIKVQEYTGKGILGGPTLFEQWEAAINDPFYQGAKPQGKAAILQKVYAQFREQAKAMLIEDSMKLGGDPEALINRIKRVYDYERSLFVPEAQVQQ